MRIWTLPFFHRCFQTFGYSILPPSPISFISLVRSITRSLTRSLTRHLAIIFNLIQPDIAQYFCLYVPLIYWNVKQKPKLLILTLGRWSVHGVPVQQSICQRQEWWAVNLVCDWVEKIGNAILRRSVAEFLFSFFLLTHCVSLQWCEANDLTLISHFVFRLSRIEKKILCGYFIFLTSSGYGCLCGFSFWVAGKADLLTILSYIIWCGSEWDVPLTEVRYWSNTTSQFVSDDGNTRVNVTWLDCSYRISRSILCYILIVSSK